LPSINPPFYKPVHDSFREGVRGITAPTMRKARSGTGIPEQQAEQTLVRKRPKRTRF